MWNSWTAVVPAALLFWATVLGNLDRSVADLQCLDTEFKVLSPYFKDPQNRKCGDIIGKQMTAQYDNEMVDACRRRVSPGVQGDKPVVQHSVAKCDDDKEITEYAVEMCCQKPPENQMLCYHCEGFMSEEECLLSGTTEAMLCGGPDENGNPQVCKTTVEYVGTGVWGRGLTVKRSTTCAPKSECDAAMNAKEADCQSDATKPECVTCCEGPLCNEVLDDELPLTYVGPVCTSPDPVHGPCLNRGKCRIGAVGLKCDCEGTGYTGERCESKSTCDADPDVCNTGICEDLGDLEYKCHCRIGYHGDHCADEYDTCEDSYCLDRGQCFNHTGTLRCRCNDGYLGDQCEIERPVCPGEHTTRLGKEVFFRTGKQRTCTKETQKRHLDTSVDEWCVSHMNNTFNKIDKNRANYAQAYIEKVHGRSYKNSDVGISTFAACEAGDATTIAQNMFCCPSCMSAPCYNGGYCVDNFSDESGFACRCRHGFGGKQCEFERAICTVSGDPHYITFDGHRFGYQGPSELYIFYQSANGDTTVYISTQSDGRVAYAREVTIETCNHKVVMNSNGVTVDERPVNLDDDQTYDHVVGCMRLYKKGEFYHAEIAGADIGVGFDGDTTAYVEASASSEGNPKGLCGDLDGVKENDQTKKDTTFTADTPQFAESWAVRDPNEPNTNIILPPDPVCPEPEKYESYCLYIKGDVFDNAYHLDKTSGILEREADYQSCIYDACFPETNPQQAACNIMKALVQRFGQEGPLENWREATNCLLTCPEGLVAHYDVTPCLPTCQNHKSQETCVQATTNICGCPDGTVLDTLQNKCVAPEDCDCVTSEGKALKVGESTRNADCTKEMSCEVCEKCGFPGGTLYTRDVVPCEANEECKVDDEGHHGCVQKTECTSNGKVYQSGEDWIEKETCAVTKECLEGVVSVNEERDPEKCQPYEEPTACVMECNEIKAAYKDSVITGDTKTIEVIAGDKQDLLVKTSLPSKIVLSQVAGGLTVSETCEEGLETCSLSTTFTRQDALYGDASLNVVVIYGNRRTITNYPVNIKVEGGQLSCPDSEDDIETEDNAEPDVEESDEVVEDSDEVVQEAGQANTENANPQTEQFV